MWQTILLGQPYTGQHVNGGWMNIPNLETVFLLNVYRATEHLER